MNNDSSWIISSNKKIGSKDSHELLTFDSLSYSGDSDFKSIDDQLDYNWLDD